MSREIATIARTVRTFIIIHRNCKKDILNQLVQVAKRGEDEAKTIRNHMRRVYYGNQEPHSRLNNEGFGRMYSSR